MSDKKQSDSTQFEKHKILSKAPSQSEPTSSSPTMSNEARTRLVQSGGMPELPFEAGNQAVTGVIEKVTSDIESLLTSDDDHKRYQNTQDRTDALFGMGPMAKGRSRSNSVVGTGPSKPTPVKGKSKAKSGSTKASGWKQFKRRVGEIFGTKKSKEGAARREIALSEKYGIRIGPGEIEDDVHMTHSMLDRIEKVLDQLPVTHLSGNDKLVGISGNQGEGAASTYSPSEKVIGINRPFNMPGWLYAILNPYWSLQRTQMEKGAMDGYKGINEDEDKALGIKSRSVFAGVNDVLAQENLLQNTIRHEVGHAVDEKIRWEENESGEEKFGSWKKHYDYDGAQDVVSAMLARAGLGDHLDDQVSPGKTLPFYLSRFVRGTKDAEDASANRPTSENLTAFLDKTKHSLLDKWMNANPGTRDKMATFVESMRVAVAQAWTMSDGGGDRVLADGRMYHMDHYENWVSYSAEARTHALSNYQFSTPSEWFAEAYTAYYNPEDSEPRSQLIPEVREWFEEQLGPPQAKGAVGRNESEGALGEDGTLSSIS